jgi:hypothetical protein
MTETSLEADRLDEPATDGVDRTAQEMLTAIEAKDAVKDAVVMGYRDVTGK